MLWTFVREGWKEVEKNIEGLMMGAMNEAFSLLLDKRKERKNGPVSRLTMIHKRGEAWMPTSQSRDMGYKFIEASARRIIPSPESPHESNILQSSPPCNISSLYIPRCLHHSPPRFQKFWYTPTPHHAKNALPKPLPFHAMPRNFTPLKRPHRHVLIASPYPMR